MDMLDNSIEKHQTLVVENKGKKSILAKIGLLPLGIAATVSLVCSMSLYINYSVKLDENRQKSSYLSELNQLAERVEKSALLAPTADANSFKILDSSKDRIEKLLNILKEGGSLDSADAKIKPMDGKSAEQLDKVFKQWEENKALIETLLKQKDVLPALKAQVQKAHANKQGLIDAVAVLQPTLQKNNAGVNPMLVQEISILNERILASTVAMFAGEGFPLEKGYSLVKDLRVFNQVLQNIKNGSYVFNSPKVAGESLEAVNNIEKAYKPYFDLINSISAQVSTLNDAKEVSQIMSASSREIAKAATQFTGDTIAQVGEISNFRLFSFLTMGLTLFFFILLIIKLQQRSEELGKLATILQKNQNNEAAVTVLIEQMQPLAKGDLSQKIDVEDKFLQQVASGMDNARSNLSAVVIQMKQSAQKVLSIAQSNAETSTKLNDDAQLQIIKLGETLDSVNSITNDLDEVAQAAYGAKEDSVKSKDASEEGERLVKATITRMDGIRNNIQESSKKIKKLGESAQTITNIIDLIRDITKKINILSLNAAIQAASSKSSTREFTVLAQEVQDLAKDSEEATSKIEELVKDIQQDTAEAIASMERTTQEVVEGAKLTQEAGEALRQIGELSISVAEQVQEAANKLEEKSSEMALVSLGMEDLRKISAQTVESSVSSQKEVASLQDVAGEINETVGHFKV